MLHTCLYCEKVFDSQQPQCPRCGHTNDNAPQAPVDETRAVEALPVAGGVEEPDKETSYEVKAVDDANRSSESDAQPFRPVQRPAMAALCVLFDGSRQFGEWYWLRDKQTTIGRSEGDVTICNDPGVSNPHARITREQENGRFRWILKDLNSDNGTFLRIRETVLTPNQELVIGTRRLRFSLPDGGAAFAEVEGESVDKTRVWRTLSSKDLTKLVPALVETTPEGEERTYPLMPAAENWVGRDADRANVVVDDPFVNPRHVRIFNDSDKWICKDDESTNGTWLRVEETVLVHKAEFQLGEQRFRLLLAKGR